MESVNWLHSFERELQYYRDVEAALRLWNNGNVVDNFVIHLTKRFVYECFINKTIDELNVTAMNNYGRKLVTEAYQRGICSDSLSNYKFFTLEEVKSLNGI